MKPLLVGEMNPYGADPACSGVGVDFAPFTTWASLAGVFVVLPHPSGLSRSWNDPANFERARATLRKAGVL